MRDQYKAVLPAYSVRRGNFSSSIASLEIGLSQNQHPSRIGPPITVGGPISSPSIHSALIVTTTYIATAPSKFPSTLPIQHPSEMKR